QGAASPVELTGLSVLSMKHLIVDVETPSVKEDIEILMRLVGLGVGRNVEIRWEGNFSCLTLPPDLFFTPKEDRSIIDKFIIDENTTEFIISGGFFESCHWQWANYIGEKRNKAGLLTTLHFIFGAIYGSSADFSLEKSFSIEGIKKNRYSQHFLQNGVLCNSFLNGEPACAWFNHPDVTIHYWHSRKLFLSHLSVSGEFSDEAKSSSPVEISGSNALFNIKLQPKRVALRRTSLISQASALDIKELIERIRGTNKGFMCFGYSALLVNVLRQGGEYAVVMSMSDVHCYVHTENWGDIGKKVDGSIFEKRRSSSPINSENMEKLPFDNGRRDKSNLLGSIYSWVERNKNVGDISQGQIGIVSLSNAVILSNSSKLSEILIERVNASGNHSPGFSHHHLYFYDGKCDGVIGDMRCAVQAPDMPNLICRVEIEPLLKVIFSKYGLKDSGKADLLLNDYVYDAIGDWDTFQKRMAPVREITRYYYENIKVSIKKSSPLLFASNTIKGDGSNSASSPVVQ
ncbi:MAG: hypothetical protein WAX79_06950, partial [Candidatus Omnitrophota bacterium]